jgi:hypothetical protein
MPTEFLRLPVVSAGAEYLVMGYLMRRNILAYKAPMNNEGYDLICISGGIHAILAILIVGQAETEETP